MARKLKTKQAVHRYLESGQELSSSAASDIEKMLSSSDSDTSGSSLVRRRRGMRDILRKSYDKILKHGLNDENVNTSTLNSNKSKHCIKSQCTVTETNELKSPDIQTDTVHAKVDIVNTPIAQKNTDCKYDKKPETTKTTHKRYLMHHLLDKAKRLKAHRTRRRSLRPNVKKKFRKRYIYPSSKKHSKNMQKRTRSSHKSEIHQNELRQKSWRKSKMFSKESESKSETKSDPVCQTPHTSSDIKESLEPKHSFASGRKKKASYCAPSTKSALGCSTSQMPSSSDNIPKPKHSLAVGRKRFILPSVSARSSRKIIPRKRYIDELEQSPNKILDEDSHGSRSSLSGSSEAISAMDGESSPDDTQPEVPSHNSKKKIGLLDQPLVVEGKRPWKPSLKVQMKLSEMNCDYPFALKKNIDGSSGTSSGSFKDIIKPDMVSKYAEKMAQKPKEKPLKVVESSKKSSNIKCDPERTENDSSDALEDGKKPEDKLEKVAAKIEKILKSQWEGRLKNSKENSSKKLSSQIVAQWKTEQQQRCSNQRRTKNILRKARLQLKRKNLNLRTRQSVKQTSPSSIIAPTLNAQSLFEKAQSNSSGVSFVDQKDVPSKATLCKFFEIILSSKPFYISFPFNEFILL